MEVAMAQERHCWHFSRDSKEITRKRLRAASDIMQHKKAFVARSTVNESGGYGVTIERP
jgi:hypothetical protein